MRISQIVMTATSILAMSVSAHAAATQAEADSITQAIQKYLSSEQGVVTIALAGDAYDLTIDLAPLFAKVSEPGYGARISPSHIKLTPLGNGKWQVDQSEPITVLAKAKDLTEVEINVANAMQTGIFDEALSTFSSSKYEFKNLEFKQSITDALNKTRQYSTSTVEAVFGETQASLNATGGVDVTGQYTSTNAVASTRIGPKGAANTEGAISFSYKVDKTTSNSAITNFRTKDFLAIAAWFVAHPSKESITKNQSELRGLLKAAVPFFDTLETAGSSGKMSFTTQLGNLEIGALEFLVGLNGATSDGRLRERFSFTDLKLPTGVLPPWSTPLLPTSSTIDFTLSGFNANDPVLMILENFDFATDPPLKKEIGDQLLKATFPQRTMQMAISPGSIVAPTYKLEYDGNLVVNIGGLPSGNGKIKMEGFEKTLEALQQAAASDPSINQVIGPMMAIRGFSKTEGNALVWEIESTLAGGVLVNGIDITKMSASP